MTNEEDKRMVELMDDEYRKFAESVFGASQIRPNFYDNF